MKKKILKNILVGLAVISQLCSSKNVIVYAAETESNDIKATIEVSSNISKEEMKEYLEGFNQKYPGITIDYKYYSDYENEIKAKIEANDYGDVLFVPSYIGSGEYSKYFEPLGTQEKLEKKYNYLETSKVKNQIIYGIPSYAYVVGILYNKDVFDMAGVTETPKSIDEFEQALQSIKDRTDAIPFYTNYAAGWTLQYWEQFPFLEMTGNPNYKENGFVNELNPFLEGTTHYAVYGMFYDIIHNGLSEENPSQTDWEQSKLMLNEGEIGCMAIGSWALNQVQESGDNGDAVAFMPFPNEVNGKQYMTVATDYCYGINANSKEKEAARLYIDYMLDESGYALDHETLSLVKTDPYPESYGDMENVVCLSNMVASSENYQKRLALSEKLNILDSTDEIKRVIEAASGMTSESFDEIAKDWNERWESSRTEEMMPEASEIVSIQSGIISEEYEVSFSETEKEYLESLSGLRVGYLKNMAPYQYETDEGFEGVAADILKIVSENIGLSMEYYGYDNTDEMIQALANGDIDIAAGVEKSDEYENIVKYSRDYAEYMNVIVKSDTLVTEELDKGKEAVVEGEINRYTEDDNTNVFVSKSLREGIKSVDSLKADYIMSNFYSADYYIKEEDCEHVTVLPMAENGKLYFAFSKNVDTRLVSVCNKCIYSIPSGNVQIMLMEHMEPAVQEITLKRFVEANPLLCLTCVSAVFLLIVVVIVIIMREREKSARKHAMDVKRYEMLSALVDEYVFEYDTNANIIHFDKKFTSKFSFSGDVNLNTYQKDNEQMNVVLEQLAVINESEENSSPAFTIRMESGEKEWYKLVAYTINDTKGKTAHLIGKLVNAQEEMVEKQQIQDKAQRDPLTGLYNRDGLKENFEKLYKESLMPVVFAIMDIDNFKGVNDTLGHDGGDEALKLLAQNLNEIFKDTAVIARYGGDEFILCIYKADLRESEKMLEELVRRMDRKFGYCGHSVHLSISMGAVYSEEKTAYEELFRKSDNVLYKVKENGKNNYSLKSL